jgi:hypothetical protein
MRRCISLLRPLGIPRLTSLWFLSCVALGSMEYSALTQPDPWPLKNGGTRFSTDAVQCTTVSPSRIIAEPSAYLFTPLSSEIFLSSPARLPSARTAAQFITTQP